MLESDPEVLLFDAGGTLLHLDHRAIAEVCFDAQTRPDDDAFEHAEQAARLEIEQNLREGVASTDSSRMIVYMESLLRHVGVNGDDVVALRDRILARHREGNLWRRVIDGTHEALDRLRSDGYRLAAISNSDGRVRELFRVAGMLDRLEIVIDSHELGIEKPDPRIFKHACEAMRTTPVRSLYIGDVYEVDVMGARAAGMPAMLIDALNWRTTADVPRIASVLDLPEFLATIRATVAPRSSS